MMLEFITAQLWSFSSPAKNFDESFSFRGFYEEKQRNISDRGMFFRSFRVTHSARARNSPQKEVIEREGIFIKRRLCAAATFKVEMTGKKAPADWLGLWCNASVFFLAALSLF